MNGFCSGFGAFTFCAVAAAPEKSGSVLTPPLGIGSAEAAAGTASSERTAVTQTRRRFWDFTSLLLLRGVRRPR